MTFLTLRLPDADVGDAVTVHIQSNAAEQIYNEHRIDRARMFDGTMRQTRQAIWRQWNCTSKLLTKTAANELIALLESNTLPLIAGGDLIDEDGGEVFVIPVIQSANPTHLRGPTSQFLRRVAFTLHETEAVVADTSAVPWLFWQRGVDRYQDILEIVPAASDDDLVAFWKDQTGNGRHGANWTNTGDREGTRPKVAGNAIVMGNGGAAPATWLDLFGAWFGSGSDMATLEDAEAMLVLRATDDPPASAEAQRSKLVNWGNHLVLYPAMDGHIYGSFGCHFIDNDSDHGNPTADLTQFQVFNPSISSTLGYSVRIGNALIYERPATDIDTFSFTSDERLGGGLPNEGDGFVGEIRELVIFDGILTAAQRAAWYAYLSGETDDPPLEPVAPVEPPTSFRFFRIRTLTTYQFGYLGFAQIEAREVALGTDFADTATVDAFDENGGHPATDAIDGNATSTYWLNSTSRDVGFTNWFSMDFGSAKAITEVKITSTPSIGNDYGPHTFKFEGSDDGVTWLDLGWSYIAEPSWGVNETRTFTRPA